MRILIAYRYFHPDTPPYASMLGEITEWLGDAGHDVTMITAQPAYKPSANIPKQEWKEQLGKVGLRRLWLLPEKGMGPAKLFNSAWFILHAFFIILFGRKQDVIMTATMPPVLQAYLLSLAARIRGSHFIYHMQDIHPEISSFHAGEMKQGILFRILRRLDISALNRAGDVVVLSPDMADVIRARGANPGRLQVIRNFALGDEAADQLLSQKGKNETGPVRFVFAGNIGLYQNLDALVDAFKRQDPTKARLIIVGDGRAKAGLLEKVAREKIDTIEFHAHMSEKDVFAFLTRQDVGLVSLQPNLYKYAFPSKIWTYIAADLPMLAMVENESDLANFLSVNDLGHSIDWHADPDDIAKLIEKMCFEVRKGAFAPAAQRQLYHRSAAQHHWVEFMDQIAKDRVTA